MEILSNTKTSSRMRTACLLTVSCCIPTSQGVGYPSPMSHVWKGTHRLEGACYQKYPPEKGPGTRDTRLPRNDLVAEIPIPPWQTDTCETCTLPELRWRAVIREQLVHNHQSNASLRLNIPEGVQTLGR